MQWEGVAVNTAWAVAFMYWRSFESLRDYRRARPDNSYTVRDMALLRHAARLRLSTAYWLTS